MRRALSPLHGLLLFLGRGNQLCRFSSDANRTTSWPATSALRSRLRGGNVSDRAKTSRSPSTILRGTAAQTVSNRTRWSGSHRQPGTRLAQLADPHPVDTLADDDLGMLAVVESAAEDTGAVLPLHFVAGAPGRGYPKCFGRCRTSIALAFLSGLAARKSCSSRHWSGSITVGAANDAASTG